jgi:hypothetical protein
MGSQPIADSSSKGTVRPDFAESTPTPFPKHVTGMIYNQSSNPSAGETCVMFYLNYHTV